MKFILVLMLLFVPFAFVGQDNFDKELTRDLRGSSATANQRPIKSLKGGGKSIASLMPDLFIALDMIFEGGTKRSDNAPNQGKIREVEFGFSANIDPYFFGKVSFVLENEGGDYKTAIHEAYIRYSGLLRGLTLRAGKLFLEQGILNMIHQHDRPFADSPLVQQEMFDYESAADFGLDINAVLFFLPFYTRLNLGVYNGQVFGHTHSSGTAKNFPLITSKLESFFALSEDIGLRIGFNYLIRSLDQDDSGIVHQQMGLDLTIKAFQTKSSGLLFLSEFWRKTRDDDNSQHFGYYLFAGVRFATVFEVGARYDYLKKEKPVALKADTALSAIVTFKPSEFSYLRVQYKYQNLPVTTGAEHLFIGQIVFILGTHPAHKY